MYYVTPKKLNVLYDDWETSLWKFIEEVGEKKKKKKSSGPVGQKHHYDVMPGNTIGMQ